MNIETKNKYLIVDVMILIFLYIYAYDDQIGLINFIQIHA